MQQNVLTKPIVKFTTILLGLFMIVNAVNAQEKENSFKIGGAVRFNLMSKSWVDDKTQPEMTWDTWRLNVDGSQGGIDFSFEYRFYPTFDTHFIHHGYLGYGFNDDLYMKLGVVQVPFGISKFASHSWWFQGQYYFGLEDDYDMGIKFDYTGIKNLDLSFAYFRQAEPEGPTAGGVTYGNAGTGRYSYDITPDSVTVDGQTVMASIRELNQFNFRAAYHLSPGLEVGASAQVGGIYNQERNETEWSTVFGAHLLADWGKGWNFKANWINHNYKATDDNGNILDIVPMGAYGSSYGVMAKANTYGAGIAKTVKTDFGPIKSLQFYVDYTYVNKTKEEFEDMQHLIPGVLISAGPVYTYVDYAMGKNQPWLNANFGQGLGAGDPDAEWNKRFNVNIGYYF